MSRSGYTDDCENLAMWRGAVNSAITGKRGQAMLRDLLAALDAMPEKRLAAASLVTEDGEFCTLGVLGRARGIDLDALDAEDPDQVATAFGIAPAMAREIVYENDEHADDEDWIDVEICGPMRRHWPDYDRHKRNVRVDLDGETAGERRWQRMRNWVARNIKQAVAA